MANAKPATKKPATSATKKPATQKPAVAKKAESKGITLKDVAEKLNRDPKSVRASIRRILGGAQVGKGKRYLWSSWDDKQLKALMSDLTKVDAE
jgi:hypothetical protein